MKVWLRDLLRTRVSAPGAYTETAIAALVNLTGLPLELLIGRDIPGIPNWPAYLSMAVGFAVLSVLFLTRKRQSWELAVALFLINGLAVVTALFLRDPYYAATGAAWVPFQASKLGCLIAALLAPGFWAGGVMIGLHAGSSVLAYALFPEALKGGLALGEPVATIAFGLAGLLTLVSRFRRIQIEERLVRTQALALETERFARTVLWMRDMMNTPLQVIEFSVALLREDAGHADAIKGLNNAVKRLNELNLILKNQQGPPKPPP
jgi:hypothetical protein